MILKNLKLTNFRNHQKLELDPGGKSVLIKGPNGIGKTNILEAVHLLATTKSLRTRYDKELIMHDKEFARAECSIEKDEEIIRLELFIQTRDENSNTSSKSVKIDNTKKSITKFAGTLNTVLFTPESIDIVTGSPSQRRKYLDSVFFQYDFAYKQANSKYIKILRQRNKILEMIREEGRGEEQLQYWNEEFLKYGRLIQDSREYFIDFLNENLEKHTKQLTEGNKNFKIKYIKKEINESKIREYRIKEVAAKSSLMGPHRDDIQFITDGFDVATYGSRGQQRTTVLATKLCEMDYLQEKTGIRPILLLDDIYSELDAKHRNAIENVIPLQQTLITSAEDATEGLEIIKIS